MTEMVWDANDLLVPAGDVVLDYEDYEPGDVDGPRATYV